MSMQWLQVYAVIFTGMFAACCTPAARAQDDPAAYCKEHSAEDRCIKYLGALSPYYSRSGNTGNAMEQPAPPANSLYVIFLHTGAKSVDTSPMPRAAPNILTKQVVEALQAKGYFVRGVDAYFDKFGPGVDYFYERDKFAAADVSVVINAILPEGSAQLTPRLQKSDNPPGYLGVWLYGSAK